jgi:hypothetical protein
LKRTSINGHAVARHPLAEIDAKLLPAWDPSEHEPSPLASSLVVAQRPTRLHVEERERSYGLDVVTVLLDTLDVEAVPTSMLSEVADLMARIDRLVDRIVRHP